MVLLLATLFLAFTNGANDNFKGVATLLGSGTTTYKRALAWATVTTFAGAMVAVAVAAELVKRFSGKGLVPDAIALDPSFLGAVGFGAAAAVLLATRLGFPISTTHALTGALVGAGLLANGGTVDWSQLGATYFTPLLVSPLLALAFAIVFYPAFRFTRKRLGVTESTQVGIPDPSVVGFVAGGPGRYEGTVIGVSAQKALDLAHYASAGAVGFARGLNDAPKIVALAVAAKAVPIEIGLGLVSASMALGGVVSARRVAETVSNRITRMNAGQGFTANLVTSMLVIGASRIGMPVSTTHVSCGALFGIGLVNKKAQWKTIVQILVAWVTTLPVAMACAALIYLALTRG